MYEKLEKFRCGGCGKDTYELYRENGNKQRIVAVCEGCKSQTEITMTTPEIKLDWGKSGDGIMAIF